MHTPKSVESALHECIYTYRVERDREFFQITNAKALEMTAEIIYPALVCDEAKEPVAITQPQKLEHAHCTLLELAFGAEPYYDLVGAYSRDYDIHHQVAQSYVDDLAEMRLLKKTKYGYELTPEGRKTCFNHPDIDLGAYLQDSSKPLFSRNPLLDYL